MAVLGEAHPLRAMFPTENWGTVRLCSARFNEMVRIRATSSGPPANGAPMGYATTNGSQELLTAGAFLAGPGVLFAN
jgi:hypothetical protein